MVPPYYRDMDPGLLERLSLFASRLGVNPEAYVSSLVSGLVSCLHSHFFFSRMTEAKYLVESVSLVFPDGLHIRRFNQPLVLGTTDAQHLAQSISLVFREGLHIRRFDFLDLTPKMRRARAFSLARARQSIHIRRFDQLDPGRNIHTEMICFRMIQCMKQVAPLHFGIGLVYTRCLPAIYTNPLFVHFLSVPVREDVA